MNAILNKSLNGITPASIEKYLSFTGWKRDTSFANHKLMVFQNNTEGNLRIAVPATTAISDYIARVYDLILTLSSLTDCAENDIIASLKSAYTDRMQFRIIAESSKNGKIPLDYAARCIEGLKELVLYAACAEEKACPICVRTFNNAKVNLDKFQFEQTEIGSFIFNVGVQVADEDNEQLFLPEVNPQPYEPPEHRIVKRIEKAILQIDDVAERRITMSNLVKNAYEEGITANMCDAISMLKPEDGDIELETSIHYAEAITRAVIPPTVRKFDNIHFALVDDISRRYKDCTLIEDVTLRGMINMLSKSASAAEEGENTVRLFTKIEGKSRAVTLHLSPENHTLACDAYRDDREVEVSGVIDKSGKYWFFSEVNSFRVIE